MRDLLPGVALRFTPGYHISPLRGHRPSFPLQRGIHGYQKPRIDTALRFDDFVGVTVATATAELFLRYRLGWVGLGLCKFAHRAARLLILIKL